MVGGRRRCTNVYRIIVLTLYWLVAQGKLMSRPPAPRTSQLPSSTECSERRVFAPPAPPGTPNRPPLRDGWSDSSPGRSAHLRGRGSAQRPGRELRRRQPLTMGVTVPQHDRETVSRRPSHTETPSKASTPPGAGSREAVSPSRPACGAVTSGDVGVSLEHTEPPPGQFITSRICRTTCLGLKNKGVGRQASVGFAL